MSDRLYKIIVFTLSFVAHAVALLQFEIILNSLPLPPKWHEQFVLLLSFSLILAMLLLFVRKSSLRWTILSLQGIIIVVAGLPLSDNLMIEFSLFTSLVLQALTYTPIWSGALFSVSILVLVGFFQYPLSAWGEVLPVASNFELLSFCLYSGLIIVFCILMRIFRNKFIESQDFQQRFDEATLNLAQTNLKLQEYAVLSEQEAKLNERKRLAREVHDTLAYTLTNLIMMMEASMALAPETNEKLQDLLEQARGQAQSGLLEVRRTIQSLRPVQVVNVTGLKAIHRLVNSFEKATAINIKLHMGDAPLEFGENADRIVYRLVQEGITNALRHGKATEIMIYFSRYSGGVQVKIKDNGIGFEHLKEGYGLIGMQERIEKIGGNTQITSKRNEGTLLSAWIPLSLTSPTA